MKLKINITQFILGICISLPVIAIPMPPVPTEPIYLEPPIVEANEAMSNSSCIQLESAIRTLSPYRYTYKPRFSEDPYNTIAVASVAFDISLNGALSAAFLGYSALVEDKEQRRILGVEQQIAMLQQLKAEKHCFE